LRMYISGVQIGGAPATIDDVAPFQAKGVALLDFEDGTGACTGSSETHTTISAHAEDASGALEFDISVPEDLDHLDPSTLVSPLNVSSMFWGWTAGFKFLKIDLVTPSFPNGWLTHIGSAACDGVTGQSSDCHTPNRLHVKLDDWDASKAVVFDLGALLENADVNANDPDTGPGCMSDPADKDCIPVFAAYGLPFQDAGASPQTVFHVE
ncbi:MAG TPA: MbnP family copper-binding protein, partial [Myxococcota bacterium]